MTRILTLGFFREGKLVKTLVGSHGKDTIKKVLEEIISSTSGCKSMPKNRGMYNGVYIKRVLLIRAGK